MLRDPYELLGVSERAGEDEIRRAYRRLVRECHPDLNPGDGEAEERFKELQQAYEALISAEKHGTRPRRSRPEASRRSRNDAEFSENLSNLLKGFGSRRKNSASASASARVGHLYGVSEEDLARLLKRFGVDKNASKVRLSFGDFADWSGRHDARKERSKRPLMDDSLKKPPKPPRPPKW